jgi:hypothetical protein
MNKQINNLNKKELLKGVENLIDSKKANQKLTNSFFGFCSRLFSVRPKVDVDFQSSLKRELLKKHSANFEREVESRDEEINERLFTTIKEFITMKKNKRFAFISTPIAIVVAFAIIFTLVINPGIQAANAMEIIAQDPEVRSVIEEYNLSVQEVEVKDNIAYIILDSIEEPNYIITVDLLTKKVGKIVEGDDGDKDNFQYATVERKLKSKGMTAEQFRIHIRDKYEIKAKSKGMTTEEFKKHLVEQKKEGVKVFKQTAEISGKTPKEYKGDLIGQYQLKADNLGMNVEEFKKSLEKRRKSFYNDFGDEIKSKETVEFESGEFLRDHRERE